MFDKFILRPGRALQLTLLFLLLTSRKIVAAEDAVAPSARERLEDVSSAVSSHSAVYSLIDRLSERGVLSKQDTTELLLAAEADEADLRAQDAEIKAARAEAAAARARLRAVMAQSRRTSPASAAAVEPPARRAPREIAGPAEPAAVEAAPLPPIRRPASVATLPERVQAPAQDDTAAAEPPAVSSRQQRAERTPPPAATEDTPPPARVVRRVERTVPPAAAVDEVTDAAPASVPVRGSRRTQPVDTVVPSRASAAPSAEAMAETAPEEPVVRRAARPATAVPSEELAAATPAGAPEFDSASGTVRVAYVPEAVKEEIRDEVRQDVLTQAAKEGWSTPGAVPEWVNKFRLFADLRVRYESLRFPETNLPSDPTNAGSGYWNFNAINTGSPFDINNQVLTPAPITDLDQDRNRIRLRARLGTVADFAEGCSAGLRLATGETNSPVSENQTLGAAGSGQGGNFSRFAAWIDRAYMKWETGGMPNQDLTVAVGRFDNPFFATSMIWADDLAFDGLAAQGKFPAGDNFTPFFAVGGFPVFNTDLNFSTNQVTKFKSYDKYLAAAQLGATFDLGSKFQLKVGSAYYFFKNVEGKVSSPMAPIMSTDAGDTDASRPAFAQKGNTYIALRHIINLPSGTQGPQYQYFGLATPFRELAFTAQLDFNQFEPFQVSLVGEYVKNLAFDRDVILKNGPEQLPGPVNNNAQDGTTFGGGPTAWMASLRVGVPLVKKRWDWNASIGYRRVESDAVVDGFCDSDFGGGGTNMKGYTVGANFAIFTDVWLGLRYMSATQIAGPNLKNDVIQFDVNSRF